MSLEEKVMQLMKEAMKAKDEALLRGVRAIKAEIIKAKTEPGANGQISEEGELKMLQKLVKQRKDSLEIFQKQNREDLARKELEEIAVIEKFLPEQLRHNVGAVCDGVHPWRWPPGESLEGLAGPGHHGPDRGAR